jgi:tetratricopeptide (TPR) repeat protein
MSIMISRRIFIGLVGATVVALSNPRPGWPADSIPTVSTPDLRAIRAEIKAKQYEKARDELKVLVVNNQVPDVLSLYGFTLRKTGDRPNAMIYYNKALAMNPSHKGALEYQGELFVELGQIDKAKENLVKLNHLCLFGCEERDDLREFIEHAPKGS